MISFDEKVININGNPHTLDYPIGEAYEYKDRVVVLYHPDAGLKMSGPFHNLICLDMDGKKLWTAEFPDYSDYPRHSNADVYYSLISNNPLKADSFSSYWCEFDLSTGKNVKQVFHK